MAVRFRGDGVGKVAGGLGIGNGESGIVKSGRHIGWLALPIPYSPFPIPVSANGAHST